MKRTYNETLFYTNEELQEATVFINLTEGVKWEDRNRTEITYTGLESWTILTDEEALEFEEKEINDLDMIDEMHEYLILNFNDGSTATFRNSHVSMFIH